LREAEDTLSVQLRNADIFNLAMEENLRAGEEVLNRLRKIAYAGTILDRGGETRAEPAPRSGPSAARQPQEAEIAASTDTSSMVAAAQAFAQRTASRVRGVAA
jgi:hypothetical protein